MGPNMPVSVVCDSAAVKCSTAIRESLSITNGHGNNVHTQLVASAKRALLDKIEYEETPPNFRNSVHDTLKSKYTVLNGTTFHLSADNNNGTGKKPNILLFLERNVTDLIIFFLCMTDIVSIYQ